MNNISGENIKKAVNIIKAHKAFKETVQNSPAQTKVAIALVVPLFFGLPFYSFMNNPHGQLIGYSVLSFIIFLFLYTSIEKPSEKWAVSLSFLLGISIWLYIFINNYRKKQQEKSTGKKSYICSPNGTCDTDGTKGPYNGLKKYSFKPTSSKEKAKNKIPANQFDIRVSNKYTYMFWLKIDYTPWETKNFYGKDKIILMKGNNKIEESDLVVWALPNENAVQFDVYSSDKKPVSLSVDFPFDKWVHYVIVVNEKVIELYKNATLEKTAVLQNPISLKKSPLYLGRTANNDYNKFPGEMLYLSYNNTNLNSEDIYDIYKKEYNTISDTYPNINNKPEPNNCPTQKCSNKNTEDSNKNFSISSVIDKENSDIQYAEKSKIPLPSVTFNKNELLNRYHKYYE